VVHWSDPEFLEWERKQVGDYHEQPIQIHGEPLTFFRCDRTHFTGSTNFAGPMVSFRQDSFGDPNIHRDAMRSDMTRITEEELRNPVW